MRQASCLLSLAFLIVATGCSTVRPVRTGKVGLFDRLFREGKGARSNEEWRTEVEPEEIAKFNEAARGWSAPLKRMSVTSPFGGRGRGFHDGLDLRAGVGTPVYSVADGKVAYAGSRIGGYGRMIVIRHEGGLSSLYAHNSRLDVRIGQTVRRGQRIALSGKTGRVSGAHVHFEIRAGITAIDPTQVDQGRWLARVPVGITAPSRQLASRRPASKKRKNRLAHN